ncbi:AAA domain-containing protein [Providencia hangzhouensis]|uniref:AAA domain-containing protein n=2 Tax=Providencia TaxID=586 RepID=UPI001C652556|nr:AAA domain-containing protein [Providencia rettgeri]WOB93354.1 AAA domain-containing protein [Providencia sp. PROV099]
MMEIKCLDPLGINGYEREANEKLEATLPNNWKGYSSLEMRGRQSKEFEGDLILITHDRIINVELKQWSGKIFSKDGKWVVQFPDGREEHRSNGVRQASRSAKILATKLKERLNNRFVPWVDHCVVLCGTATKDNLPSDEQEYVFTLEEFSKIGDETVYKQYFKDKSSMIKRKEDAPNKNLKQWDKIFSNNSADFKAKNYSVNNYILQGQPLFQHREALYAEYQSQRSDNHNYKAIMRRWNFTAPCIIEHAKTPEQRSLIAHRERDVLGYISSQDEDLKDIYLRLEYLPTELSSDFVELYEWPNKKERLDTFIRKNSKKLTEENRLNLIQALVSRLASLHDIDVAHRDLGNHSIWLSLPSKVVLSNFLTATYPDPQNKTVSNIRKILQHNQIVTPEELYEDIDGTHFTRDVYLATVACHYIAFGKHPMKDDGIYLWQPIKDDPISLRLEQWFERGLELEAAARFKDLREALTELNKLLNIGEIDCEDKLGLLSNYYSSKNIYVDFGTFSTVKVEGTLTFLKSGDNTYGLKAWFGVNDISADGGVNNQLLSFFNKLDIRKNANLKCLPQIIDYGFNPQMTCAFFQFEWVNGMTWKQFITSDLLEKPELNIKQLLSSLLELHSSNIYHGDIHPGNIIINENDLTFIDIIELDENKYTPTYAPANHEYISKANIDRYAVVKIIYELASLKHLTHLLQYVSELLELSEISSQEIIKLHDKLEQIIAPTPLKLITTYNLFHKNLQVKQEKLLSDDGKYYLDIEINKGRNNDLVLTRITGVKHRLSLWIHPENKFIVSATLDEIRHNDFIKNKKKSILELNGEIVFCKSQSEASNDFFDVILGSPVYNELLKKELNTEVNITPALTNIKSSKVTDARDVWKALVDTEHESNPRIEISTDPRIQGDKFTFQYTSEGTSLDFNLNTERVFVYADRHGELRRIGTIVDIGSNSMAINLWGKARIELGDTLVLEGALTASSLNKRKTATENLVNNRSVITNIADYFSPGVDIKPTEQAEPTDTELDSYTELDSNGNVVFKLNGQQRDAFKGLYKYGPISLLQGPPGTGKTAFIGSFIHYCISNGARRVLLVSQSHEAINNATEKVKSLFERNGTEIDIVRLGDQHVLSEQLDSVGEKALQEHYRDRFKAEYEERIINVAQEIGIDEEFTRVATEFERSFGINLDRIISRLKDTDSNSKNSLMKQIEMIDIKLPEFFSRRAGMNLNLDNIELKHYREFIYSALARHYEIFSGDLISKFKNIISISNEWLSVMASSQSQFQNFLSKTRTLVCGTCVGIGRNHYGIQENVYDLVVIDEAARSPASELAIAMQVGRKILLVGDHKQLPPLFDEEHIKAAKRILPNVSTDELKRSDFERAFVSSYGKTVGRFLRIQYRMIPAVGNLVSECFYIEEGGLKTGRSETKKAYLELFGDICTPVTWIDTSKTKKNSFESKPTTKNANQNSYVNKYETEIILEVLYKLSTHKNAEDLLIESDDPKIGIICMYGEQVKYLIREINGVAWARTLLEKGIIKVDTVDSYQGKENDIVIVSLVRSNSSGSQGHVVSENRANVAISRAKEALFIIGNSDMWHHHNEGSAFGRVYKYISEHNEKEYSIVNSQTLEVKK